MHTTSGTEALSMDTDSYYGDVSSNYLNTTPQKRLDVGGVNRPACTPLREISLLDYVRRETNIKPIPEARSGLCHRQFIPSQAKCEVKNSKQRIKKAGRQSKIWLSRQLTLPVMINLVAILVGYCA